MSGFDPGDITTWPIAWLQYVPLKPEAEDLSSLSEDTLKREHGDKIRRLSRRRLGMRRGDAIMIGTEWKGASVKEDSTA